MHNRNNPPQSELIMAPNSSIGRRIRILLYVALCVAASLVPLALEFAHYPGSESEGAALSVARALVGLVALGIFTFPMGFLAALLWWLLVMWPQASLVTPFEGVALLLPVFIALGYMQWFVWIPKFVLRNVRAASREASDSEAS